MTLHILSISPWSGDAFARCCRALREGDALLLLGDGVYAARDGSTIAAEITRMSTLASVHALDQDCASRGVAALCAGVSTTGYDGFVALAAVHPRSVSWF